MKKSIPRQAIDDQILKLRFVPPQPQENSPTEVASSAQGEGLDGADEDPFCLYNVRAQHLDAEVLTHHAAEDFDAGEFPGKESEPAIAVEPAIPVPVMGQDPMCDTAAARESLPLPLASPGYVVPDPDLAIPRGRYVASIRRKSGERRLHRVGSCNLQPGLD